MSEPSPGPQAVIQGLEEELARERDRADRAEIEAIIAWEHLALIRELVVRYKLNITMLQGYEPIRELEGCKLQDEIDRRLANKRAREAAAARAREEAESATEEND